jgi:hypothetical protein
VIKRTPVAAAMGMSTPVGTRWMGADIVDRERVEINTTVTVNS